MHSLAHIIRVALLALLLVTPWLFGGVSACVQWVLMFVVATVLALDLVTRFGQDDRPNLVPSGWLVLLAGILLGLFQLMPWPQAAAQVVAPATVELRHALLANPGSVDAATAAAGATPALAASASPPAPVRRTIYAAATREYLALLTLAFAVFVLSSIHLIDRQTLVWFFVAVPACGAALSFFGLVQRLSWNGKFYWIFEPLVGSIQSFGPFVNRNNAGGWLNLCVAAGLGLLIWVHSSASVQSLRSSVVAGSRRQRRRSERMAGRSRPEASADAEAAEYGYQMSQVVATYDPGAPHTQPRWLPRFVDRVCEYVGDLNARRLGAVALLVFTAGGVLSTASRGSILALFVAMMVTAAALAVRSGSRGYAAGLLAVLVAGVALMSWAGQTEFVRSRFELLLDESQYETGRVPNWLEALQAVPEFLIAGSGLGTYSFIYEQYQHRFVPRVVYRHAENQFIQALVDGGLIGLLLLLLAIVLMIAALIRLYRVGGALNTSLAVAGTFGLVSQVVGGLFDFGLYLPSNMMLMAALSGIVMGRAALLSVWPAEAFEALDRPSSSANYVVSPTRVVAPVAHAPLADDRYTIAAVARSQRAIDEPRRRLRMASHCLLGLTAPPAMVTLLIGFLLIGCLFGSLEMNRAGKLESAMRAANPDKLLTKGTADELSRAAARLAAALPHRWDDAMAHQRLALLLIGQYQAQTYAELERQRSVTPIDIAAGNTKSSDAPTHDTELWSRASVQHLHRTLRELERNGDRQAVNRLLISPAVQDCLRPAIRHLLAARFFAPTVSRVHYRLAELAPVDASLEPDQLHLERAHRLSPGDATLWFWSGILQLNDDRLKEACECWNRSLRLSRIHLDEIIVASQGRLTIRQLLEWILPDEADLLLTIARQHFAAPSAARYRHVFLDRAQTALDRTELPPDVRSYTQGSILYLLGKPHDAVPFYAAAIEARPTDLAWRYELVRILMTLQDFEPAQEHIEYLVAARPQSAHYRRLQDEFRRKRFRVGVPES